MRCASHILPVVENSQIAAARQQATALARDKGFGEVATGNLALVVTEAATNLIRHAGGGEIVLRSVEDCEVPTIEMLSLDQGPGMRNVEECLTDGFSTQQSSGTGLGAIRRLSNEFDIYSQPQKGTALLARVAASPQTELPSIESGAVQAPNRGEQVCGDGWTISRHAAGAVILVADGLGHGVLAAEASNQAIAAFERNSGLDLVALLQLIHGALRGSRGAAVAVAQLSLTSNEVRFAGVGNISGVVIGPEKTQGMVSHNGTAGLEVRRFQEFTYSWPAHGLVVLYSDGLASSWNLAAYPGLAQRHAGLIAGVLYRDWSRRQDDVTVVVARERRHQSLS